MREAQAQTVSLVLGSGGARGLAHIGVVRWLENHGYEIRSIAGSSMGALIGGLYAAGKLDDYESWVRAIRKIDIVSLLDVSWGRNGLFKGEKIIDTLIELVGDHRIEDLPIAYTAVATNIRSEKEVWIRSGRLFDAIRASISLPLLFTPYRYRGEELIDGGVVNPVPIAPTFGDATDITIAVNLSGAPHGKRPAPAQPDDEESYVAALRKRIRSFIGDAPPPNGGQAKPDMSVYEIASQAFDAMQGTIARQKLAAYPPDRIVDIPRDACGLLDFDRAAELIDIGARRADACLADLQGKSID
jgi:NTE family protein